MNELKVHIKPTKRCNLRCRYCFEQEHYNSPDELTFNKLHLIFNKIKSFCFKANIKDVQLNYTGGEVLTLGIEFLENTLKLQNSILKNNGLKVITNFQTNLLLLNNDFIKLIKKNKIRIGSSIDLFSKTRLFPKNNKSITPYFFDKLIMLSKNRISFGLIVMLTKENYRKSGEIFDLLNQARISFHTIILMPNTYKYATDLVLTGKEYGEALIQMLKKYISTPAKKRVRVATLESYVQNIKHNKLATPPSLCSFDEYCLGDRLFIENDGKVYPCDCLQAKEFCLGNIFYDSIEEIFHNLKNKLIFKKFRSRHLNIQINCEKCKYIKFCNGGCLAHSYWEGDPFNKSLFYCQANKKIYSYLKDNLNLINKNFN